MTVRRVDDTVLLEGVCSVEEAETLMQEIQAGAEVVDWSDCTHLHSACFQVILATGSPTRGTPANPALARWLPQLVRNGGQPNGAATVIAKQTASADLETACLTEV